MRCSCDATRDRRRRSARGTQAQERRAAARAQTTRGIGGKRASLYVRTVRQQYLPQCITTCLCLHTQYCRVRSSASFVLLVADGDGPAHGMVLVCKWRRMRWTRLHYKQARAKDVQQRRERTQAGRGQRPLRHLQLAQHVRTKQLRHRLEVRVAWANRQLQHIRQKTRQLTLP